MNPFLKTLARAGVFAPVVSWSMLIGGLPALRAEERAWSAALMARVERIDAARLPPHPRLLLSDANVDHIRAIAETPFGRPYQKVVTDWLEAERAVAPLSDPLPQKKGPGGQL